MRFSGVRARSSPSIRLRPGADTKKGGRAVVVPPGAGRAAHDDPMRALENLRPEDVAELVTWGRLRHLPFVAPRRGKPRRAFSGHGSGGSGKVEAEDEAGDETGKGDSLDEGGGVLNELQLVSGQSIVGKKVLTA